MSGGPRRGHVRLDLVHRLPERVEGVDMFAAAAEPVRIHRQRKTPAIRKLEDLVGLARPGTFEDGERLVGLAAAE